MIKVLQSELSINLIASIIVSLVFLAAGFIWGKYKERRRRFGRNLEEYDFYPFTVTRENFGEFSLKDFRLGMHYFLKNNDYTAARQLIFIGEQNNVREKLELAEQKEYARLFDMPVIQHCEDLHLSTAGVMHEGMYSTRLGLKGIPAAAEEIMVSRDLILAEMTSGKYHAAHLSTRRAVEMVRQAKARGLRVSAEVTPHHFTLTDAAVADYDTNAKMNPPLRSAGDVAALVEGIQDGTIDAIASDHAPHHINLKMLEFDRAPFGITGLETAVGLALTKLQVSVARLIELFSTNPQKIMKVTAWGLFQGSDADLTILDLNRTWTFDVNRSRSRIRNSPFHGWKLKGKAVATIVGGKVVYEDRP